MNGVCPWLEAQALGCADKMRGHMDASEYKHVCLGLIFLKYISTLEKNANNSCSVSLIPRANGSSKDDPNARRAAKIATNI